MTSSILTPGKAKIRPVSDALFLPYQQAWINDDSKRKIMEKGRQLGVSWSSAYRLVRRKSLMGTRYDAWCSSRDDGQARLLVEDCKSFAKLLQIGARDLGQIVIDDERKLKSYKLLFASGASINSMSSNPDAQAGKRGDRFLDEFALHRNPKKLYDIASPGTTWGGGIEMCSTHRGSQNYFNVLIREVVEKGNPKKVSLHTVTLQTALEQGFLFKLQTKLAEDGLEDDILDMDEAMYFDWVKSGCSDEETFLQEYMCIPADDNSAFFPYDLTAQCEFSQYEEWEKELSEIKNPIYLGVDIGRRHDLTCLWALEDNGTTLLTRKVLTLDRVPFPEQEKILWPFFALSNVRRIRIDEGGLGMELAERAQIDFGKYKVEKVMFNLKVKEEMAYAMKNLWEARGIRIPFDPKIREDFNGVKKQVTASNNVRFTADRGPGGHSDRFWACALAVTGVSKFEGGVSAIPANEKVMKQDAISQNENDDNPVITNWRGW